MQTDQFYVDRLSRYLTIAQKAMNHAAALADMKLEILQPHYDAAVVQWNTHYLRTIPSLQNTVPRNCWYEDLDVMLSNEPSPDDTTAWCIRAFAAMAAVEGINMQELIDVDDKAVGRINIQVAANINQAMGYSDEPLIVPATPQTGVELLGKELYILHPQTHCEVKHTIVDFGHTALRGDFYVLEYETLDGPLTRQLSQDEVLELLASVHR